MARERPMIVDTQQCPVCRDWIVMPSRRRRATMDKHLREVHQDAYRHAGAFRDQLLGVMV